MIKLKFKYFHAENFLCFGSEGITVNFEDYENIVVISGSNLDVLDESGKNSSNGAGKTSCLEVPVYALYGKTIKKPKKLSHADLINNQTSKKLLVEFVWDDYRVVRTRKPDSLRLWKSSEGIWDDSTEISKSGIPATQELIEDIIGLTYESFLNVYAFSDDNTSCFLESDATTKRQIVENLLSLNKYRNYSETAKNYTKNIKEKIKNLAFEFEILIGELEDCKKRLVNVDKEESTWLANKRLELQDILAKIKVKRDELERSDKGTEFAKYQDAQEEITDCKTKVPELIKSKETLETIFTEITLKCTNFSTLAEKSFQESKTDKENYEICQKKIRDNKKIIEDFNNKIGKDCPYCLGIVEEKNFEKIISKAREIVEIEMANVLTLKDKYDKKFEECDLYSANKNKLDAGMREYKNKINKANDEISGIHCKISQLSKIKEPQVGVDELLIQEQINELKTQAIAKKTEIDGPSPYISIKLNFENELKEKETKCNFKKEEVKNSEEELPYYNFWVNAFGDTGIRKYIIDGIIPALNAQLAYWLQFLIDNKIKLEFNNQLEETIDRYPFNGRPYVYHGMSGGQRRRLNLSLSQAFAYISMLNCGASPSVVFLDEVTMNMDEAGIQGIYRMICELSKEKQVFIIDHNESLLELLSGCDRIQLEMKDEVSKKVS
jgi:DNA repair exonuclease SbcCD ATPase subunit